MTRTPRPHAGRAPHGPLVAGLFLLALLALVATGVPATTEAAPPAQDFSQWRTYANGDDVWSLAFEGSNVGWAGTRGGGVIRWDISNISAPTPTQYLFPQDGLAGNFVRAVVVDDRGHKWFATNRGLSHLTPDGTWYTYTRASTGGQLASDTVTALAVSGTTLWVGSQQYWSPTDKKWVGGGFARVDISNEPPVWTNVWSADTTPETVPSNNVTDIALDASNGDAWITTRTDLESIPPTADRPDVYFRARFGGISVVHSSLAVEKFQRDETNPSIWPKSDSFLTVAIDSTGLKWFGSGDLTQGGAGVQVLKGNSVAGAQWVGFAGGGSTLPSGITTINSMPNGATRIPNITIGAQDKPWISLAGQDRNVDRGEGLGVCLMTWDRNFTTLTPPTCSTYDTNGGTANQPIPGNMVRALLLDPAHGAGFFGTGGRLPDSDDALYPQGTDGHGIGLVFFSPPSTVTLSTFGLTPSSNHVSAVGYKADGTIWLGNAYPTGAEAWGGKGLDILNLDGHWSHENIGSNVSQAISSLAFDNKGRLWVGLYKEQKTDGTTFVDGGVAVDKQPWVLYQSGTGLPSNSISALAADGATMWVGTGDQWPVQHGSTLVANGVGVYNTNAEAWSSPVQSPPLLGNEITAISSTGGKTLFGDTWPSIPGTTEFPGGLNLYDGTTWTNYPASQNGLTLNAADPRSVYLAPDGTLWAGGYFSQRPLPNPVLSDAVVNWLPSGETSWHSVTFKDDGWASAIARRAKANGSIWVGTSRGGQNVEDFPAVVFPAGKGNEYYATGGIRVYANGSWSTFTPASSPLVSGHITALTVDTSDNLWIGTTMGLMRYSGDIPSATVVPSTPPATYTPSPTPLPTGTLIPTVTPQMITPSAGGSAPTLTPSYPTATPTPFPGSPPPEVPEVSTIWLLGSGLAGLAGYIRFLARRRK